MVNNTIHRLMFIINGQGLVSDRQNVYDSCVMNLVEAVNRE